MDAARPLAGQRIVEIGVGTAASTVALAEQGADVIGLDVVSEDLDVARTVLDGLGLEAALHHENATEVANHLSGADHLIYWAVLEHMTVPERLLSLRAAWENLAEGALLTVVETPNRLWPHDSHTSGLPFFSWLPQDLAFRYSRHSERVGFGDRYVDEHPPEAEFQHFLRRGLGVSYHEFAVAFDVAPSDIEVVSCMQLERRRAAPYRQAGWQVSAAGRTERTLRGFAPEIDRAWFQPFLYLTLRRSQQK